MKIWVLYIEHRHGCGFTVHKTEDEAQAKLADWVHEYWNEEMPKWDREWDFDNPTPIPTDNEIAIEQYFDVVQEEDFSMDEAELAGVEPVVERTNGRLTDEQALDEMATLFSASEWPGSSGLEDLCSIVRGTGRKITDDPTIEWARH
jgi:hypothetical protein